MEEANHENSEMADDSLTSEIKNEEVSVTKLLKSTDSVCKEETDTCLIKKEDLIKMFVDKENALRNEFQAELNRELMIANEKFDLVLQNEQIRTSYMLREAHRERQEKIISLQKQLECKNLAGLMYVMCSERRKSKLEKLRIIEEYTNYIRVLQAILAESQDLILNLSRGYKTAARVDHEWREKMKLVVGEFQAFVNDFTGATPDENKYFFDLPFLLKINSPIVDNPEEDPCECWDEKFVLEPEEEGEKQWWETVGGDCRPFIMFGDMADFKPPKRRQVLRAVKAAKTAPPKWKEYVFNDTYLRAECEHIGSIKHKYPHRDSLSRYTQGVQTVESQTDRKVTGEPRATLMGSIIKMMASRSASILQSQPETNMAILGAKDSLEIASTTRVLEKSKEKRSDKFSFNEDMRKSMPPDQICQQVVKEKNETNSIESCPCTVHTGSEISVKLSEEESTLPKASLGSQAVDSLTVVHVPDEDHNINYEKICPMEECQRMQVDSFMRSLPSYMRANPFTHFAQNYEDYEPCSPEQLEMLRQRLQERKKSHEILELDESPTDEWGSETGVGVQTSDMSMSMALPPCTCHAPSPSPASSAGMIFNIEDLIPVKEALDTIKEECFHDSKIQFDRFKVIGQRNEENTKQKETRKSLAKFQEIRRILERHPSLCEIFQGNTIC